MSTEKPIQEIFSPSQITIGQALERLNEAIENSADKLEHEIVVNHILKAEKLIESEINMQEWRERITAPIEYPEMNTNVLYGYFYHQYPKQFGTIKEHDYFMENAKKIAAILSRDVQACKDYGFDPEKGIFLYGGLGVGKTSIMKCYAYILNTINNPEFPAFRTASALDIVKNFVDKSNGGLITLNKYAHKINEGTLKNGGWFFDDIGVEPEANHYGTKANVIESLLQLVYNKKEMHGHVHASTNISEDQIKERYGERVYSRMTEMFNLITFPAEAIDMRNK